MSNNPFRQATKARAKLRLALIGPSGSGKTYTALTLAQRLAGNGTVAVLDTERGSASLYADLFRFDVLELASEYGAEVYALLEEIEQRARRAKAWQRAQNQLLQPASNNGSAA